MATRLHDVHLNPVTSRHPDAVKCFDEALLSWCEMRPTRASECLADTLRLDPSFVMGHVLRAVQFEENAVQDAMKSVTPETTWRERKHIEAASLVNQKKLSSALDVWEEILVKHPTDLFALRFAQDLHYYLGESFQIRDSVARTYPIWEEKLQGTRGFGLVQGLYAFGLEESFNFGRAEAIGKKAVELNSKDGWAVHAVTHVLEMETRIREGVDWMENTVAGWREANGLAAHNHWHNALFHIELGKFEEVLHLYDTKINVPKPSNLDLVDCSSLLFRLELAGCDVEERWSEVAEKWGNLLGSNPAHLYAFEDVHAGFSFFRGKKDHFPTFVSSIRKFIEQNSFDEKITEVPFFDKLALPLLDAIKEFFEQNYESSAQILYPLRTQLLPIGGSHAQRDLFQQILIESCLRGNSEDWLRKGQSLVRERTQMKPASPFSWNKYQTISQKLADTEHASFANSMYISCMEKWK